MVFIPQYNPDIQDTVGGRVKRQQALKCKQSRWLSMLKAWNKALCLCGANVECLQEWSDSLVKLQVKDEGWAEGLHQEAALGQMDRLREG